MLTLECIICGSSYAMTTKCAGPQNMADALTNSLPRPALSKHRQYMWGTRIPFSALYLSLKTGWPPTASYNIITPCGYQVARAA